VNSFQLLLQQEERGFHLDAKMSIETLYLEGKSQEVKPQVTVNFKSGARWYLPKTFGSTSGINGEVNCQRSTRPRGREEGFQLYTSSRPEKLTNSATTHTELYQKKTYLF
jgi:hypothetical protein